MDTTKKPLHIFKPGRHITMSGEPIEFTEADLQATATAYNPRLHNAPLVKGHPKTDDPAQGSVVSLTATERGLFAVPAKVDPAFAEDVNAGKYIAISAKFYRPADLNNPVPGVWYLRHVGFLGAQPPAIKGLDEPSFAEDDGVCFQEGVEFSDWAAIGLDDNATLWRRVRDWMIAKFGLETADEVVPDWRIESLREAAERERQGEKAPAFAEPVSTKKETTQVTPEEKAALEAENTQLKAQLAAAKVEKDSAARQRRHDDNAAFAEALIEAGTLAPAHKATVTALLDDAGRPDDSPEFSEADGQKKPLADALKAFLQQLPPVVEFGEHATKDKAGTGAAEMDDPEFAEKSTDQERLTLHKRALALSAAEKIPYEQAVRRLLK